VADILKGLIGGSGGTFVLAWVFPSAIALIVLYVLDKGRLGIDTFLGAAGGPIEHALALAIGATAIAVVGNALSTPMYRLLEGYTLPAAIQRRLIDSERRRRDAIESQTKSATGITLSLLQERLQRFPRIDGQTAPTRLGNALRAFETYAVDRYRLDSQMFWNELVAVVPDSLRRELDLARSSVDFFVAATYLSVAVGVVTGAAGLLARPGPDLGLLAVGLIALLLSRVWYSSAVTSTSYWDSTVRALVNLGRVPLAASLGLRLPASIDAERKMWALVVRFAYYGYEEGSAVRLDEFRLGADPGRAPRAVRPPRGRPAIR
jgi:hypothetical protein